MPATTTPSASPPSTIHFFARRKPQLTMQHPQDLPEPSSQPRPGRYGAYPPIINPPPPPPGLVTHYPSAINQLNQTSTISPPKDYPTIIRDTPFVPKNYTATIRNTPSILNQLATFSDASKVTPHNKCPFIKRLSTDVRAQIYKYLLLNPILSTSEAVSKETDFGVTQKYDLHPSILGTCKEVYEEASAVLYGLNTFYMVAMKSTRMHRFTLADFIGGSSLTRYWRENADIFNVSPEARLYLCKVRQWRVEISCYGSPGQSAIELPLISIRNPVEYGVTQSLPIDPRTGIPPPTGRRRCRNQYIVRLGSQEARDTISEEMVSFMRPLLEYSLVPFCHLISLCEEPPLTLEIIIKPKASEEEVPMRSEYLGLVPTESEKLRLINPLEMLRGMTSLKFTHSPNPDNTPIEISSRQLSRESILTRLVTYKEGYFPAECPSNIYTNLLSYAQAFERYEPFKQLMGANWLYQNAYKSTPNPFKSKTPNPIQFSHPFGPQDDNYKSHPVNRYLSQAASAIRRHDVVALKEARRAVIEYLEPQYKRIVDESKKFSEFIEVQSKRYGIWDGIVRLRDEIDRYEQAVVNEIIPMLKERLIQDRDNRLGQRIMSIDFAEALVVLEGYAEAFNRDIPHETRKQIARIRFEYQGHYDIMEREVAIRKLQQMVVDIPESMNDAAVRFKELYMIAANDMQKQYLEIRDFRKRLFEDDREEDSWECATDLKMEIKMEDKEIDWTVPRDDPSHPAGQQDTPGKIIKIEENIVSYTT